MTVGIVEIAGQKMALLPIADYQHLVDMAEDKADTLSAIEAERRRLDGEEYLPAEMVDRILDGESSLRVWRQHRGMTLEALAKATNAHKSAISELGNGKAQGNPALWRNLAAALNVAVDDILPEG
jgi:DNA-binding XRE family transcriptional regulator